MKEVAVLTFSTSGYPPCSLLQLDLPPPTIWLGYRKQLHRDIWCCKEPSLTDFPFLSLEYQRKTQIPLLSRCYLFAFCMKLEGGEKAHKKKSHASENVHLLIRILNCKNVLLLQKLLQFDWEVGRGEGIRSTKQIPKWFLGYCPRWRPKNLNCWTLPSSEINTPIIEFRRLPWDWGRAESKTTGHWYFLFYLGAFALSLEGNKLRVLGCKTLLQAECHVNLWVVSQDPHSKK